MKTVQKWYVSLMTWIIGPTFFFDIGEAPDEMVIAEFNRRIPWLPDDYLGALVSALEVEIVNRMADRAGYYDGDLEAWIAPLEMATYPSTRIH